MCTSRIQFYFMRQDSRCYLRLTQPCQERDGVMRLGGKNGHDLATWDHLKPKMRATNRGKPGIPHNRLLACYGCNHKKGARTDLATDVHFDMAFRFMRDWATHVRAAIKENNQREKVKPIKFADAISPEDQQRMRDATQRAHPPPEMKDDSPEAKANRARALGVTDPRYLPGAKNKPLTR